MDLNLFDKNVFPILVTGVAGFIGSQVARKFLNEGYKVIGIDDLSSGKIINVPKKTEFLCLDLSKPENISLIPKNCKLILHLAGQSSGEISFDNPILDLQKNTQSTLNLINYGIQNKSNKIIYASSMSVYGNTSNKAVDENFPTSPISCYGVGKLASENYLKIYSKSLPYISIRMFNVYGYGQDLNNLRQGMVSIYLSQAIYNKKIIVKGSLNRFRDFVYIDDMVDIWYSASIDENLKNFIVNAGTGIKTDVSQLLNVITREIKGSYIVQDSYTLGDQVGIFSDNRKLIENLYDRKFTNLEDGIGKFINEIRLNK